MEMEPLLEGFLEDLHVAAYSQDGQGRVIYLTPAATRLTGWRQEEVVGRRSHEIFGGTVVCPCEDCRHAGGHGSDPSRRVSEGTIRTRSGALRPVRVGVSSLRDRVGKSTTVVMIEDLVSTCPAKTGPSVGEPSWNRLASATRDRFIDILFDAIPDGISVLDPDLTVRRVNRTMTTWYRDRMPLVGRRCYDCYQNRIGPCFRCPSLRCLESGRVEREIVAGPTGSGIARIELLSFPVKDPTSGKVEQVVEFVRDITDTVHLENGRRLVGQVTEMARSLRQALENEAGPWAAAPPSWVAQAEALVQWCDRTLAQWPDLKAEQIPSQP
jgi:PAS domain S-box-containing protein